MKRENIKRKLTELMDMARGTEKVYEMMFRQPLKQFKNKISVCLMIVPGRMDYTMRGDMHIVLHVAKLIHGKGHDAELWNRVCDRTDVENLAERFLIWMSAECPYLADLEKEEPKAEPASSFLCAEPEHTELESVY